MALKIVWSKRADKKFDKIIEYLNKDFGEGVTKSFVRKVYDFLDILSEYPEIGSIENRERGIRGFTVVKNINVFYRFEDKTTQTFETTGRRGEKFFAPTRCRSTCHIIAAARANRLPDQIMLTIHPQRWTDKPLPWLQELLWQNVKNVV